MTIGQTLITLATVVEHAFRRAGIAAESQTPSNVETAKNNLFFILTNFANKGMTYWCVDQQYITLSEGQATMSMPSGTIDVYNANYRRMTLITTETASYDTTYYYNQYDVAVEPVMFRLNSSYVGDIVVSTGDDPGLTTTLMTISHDGTDKWYTIDSAVSCRIFKLLVTTGTLTITSLTLASGYIDVPMYRMNRDQYSTLPNKTTPGEPLQYWFDRQINPTMNLWPATSAAASSNCIHIFRNHQIADVGDLDTSLEIPNRWLEATIWGLAENLAFEIPGVQAERANMCMQKAASTLNDAQVEERDNSPIQWGVNIGVYTT